MLILLLVLAGCASQKFIAEKGVFYPKEEAARLDGLTRLDIPVMAGAAGNMLATGDLQFLEGRAFLPVIVTSKAGSEPLTHSIIYALDGADGAVLDTLVLTQDEYMKFNTLVAARELFIVGEQDTLLHVIKADKELNIIQRYPIDIHYKQIHYAGTAHDKFRIVVSDRFDNLFLYEFRTEDLTLERSRLLSKGLEEGFDFSAEGRYLWALKLSENLLSTVRFDLSAMNPDPAYKEFMIPVNMQSKFQVEIKGTAGDHIYLAYTEKEDPKYPEKVTTFKIIALDYNQETSTQKAFAELPTTYQISPAGENVYFYSMQTDIKKALNTYGLAKASPDLQTFDPVVRFLETDRKVKFNALDEQVYKLAEHEGKLYFTGLYYQNMGKLKAGDTYLYRTSDNFRVQPQIFFGSFTPGH